MSASVLRRQALPGLIEEARIAARSTREIHEHFDRLAEHAESAKARVDFARSAREWAAELKADVARLADLEGELAALEAA